MYSVSATTIKLIFRQIEGLGAVVEEPGIKLTGYP